MGSLFDAVRGNGVMSRSRDLVLELEAIARGLLSTQRLADIGPALWRATDPLIRFDRSLLMLRRAGEAAPTVVHARGVPKRRWSDIDEASGREPLSEVLRDGATVLAPPTSLSTEELATLGLTESRSLLLQPVLVHGDIVGLVAFCSRQADAFDELDVALSSFVAKLVGEAWERHRQESELRQRNAILSTLAQVTDRLLREDTWEGAVDEVLERVGTVSQASRAYVFEVHRSRLGTLLCSQRFEWVDAGTEPQIDNPDLQDLALHEAGFGRWVRLLSEGDRVVGLVKEFPHSEQELLARQGILSVLAVPISDRGRWWGFLGFDDCSRERSWTRMEIETLQTVAHALGAAIQAARYRRRLERTQRRAQESATKLERALEGTVGALLTIMETRDQRLANHQRRVAELALAMAQLMGLDRDGQQATWLAALVHDLGKLSLPFWLVSKGEELAPEDRHRVRAHVRLGQQALAPLDLPWPVAEIVGQHHERPDGRGYPLGLRSPNIRREAQIIRVADYVETRATRLEFGEGVRIEDVLHRLNKGAGTRFDPDAVDACVALFEGAGFFFTTPASPLDAEDQLELSSTPPTSSSALKP
jgi:HD-GYP domain-containing protein (c-di-GMP phosphodiesterase class II)